MSHSAYERGFRCAVELTAQLAEGHATRFNCESGRWERDACLAVARRIREELGPKRIESVDRGASDDVCRGCGTPWGMRHAETCTNVPVRR